jgi:sensor histidine kinase regulating citrate/malate metabolism
METYFAPAERIENSHIMNQVKSIGSSHTLNTMLQNNSELLLVINPNRQIVAFNNVLTDSLGIADPEKAVGLRLGEVLQCKYAFDEPNGCGTTPYCSSCGAVIAMMAAIDDDQPCERRCALTTDKRGHTDDYCLLVRSQPVVTDGNRWILVYIQDISKQQHWEYLENEFLLDLDNKLCLVHNYSAFLRDQLPAHEVINKLNLTLGRVVREVKLQAALKEPREIESLALVEKVTLKSIRMLVFNVVLNRNTMTGKLIVEEGTSQSLSIITDPVLASRVIVTMLINALEATEVGGTVKLTAIVEQSQVTWQVWNKGYIPENVKLRIFQKYFSTKSKHGHGLGTYRMKLLGEKYLGGKVSFESSVDEGTTFSFALPLG